MKLSPLRRALLLCLFLSGAAALMEEVVWEKYLGVLFGSTAVSRTLILTAFMGGLSAGYFAAGSLAGRVKRRLLAYASLEAAVGLYALASPVLFTALSAFLRLSAAYSGGAAPGLRGSAAALAVLAAPTMLMGATLPFLALEAELGSLYSANNFGGVAGAVLAGFVLLPAVGLDASARWAGCFNLAAAALALAASRRKGPPAASAVPASAPEGPPGLGLAIRAGAFTAGLCALAQEHVWTRFLGLMLGSSTHSFSLVLAAYIAGLGWGAAQARGLKPARPARAFGLCLAATGLASLAAAAASAALPVLLFNLRVALNRTPETYPLYAAAEAALCFLLLLGPAFFSGLALPLAAEADPAPRRDWGGSVGAVFGLNALGAIAGAAGTGLVLIPRAGLTGALLWSSCLPAAAGAALLAYAGPARRRWLAPGAALAALGVLLALRPGWSPAFLSEGPFDLRLSRDFISFEDYRRAVADRGLVYYKDGADASVAVLQWAGGRYLKINGKTEASSVPDLGTQLLSGHLPFILFPGRSDEKRAALVIGMGSGNTLGAVLTHPVAEADLLEISPEVVQASRAFEPDNGRPLDDPRTKVLVRDAGPFMRLAPWKWDLIISEPSNPWVAGVSGLFTRDFFLAAQARLKPGGALVQWFHLYNMDNESVLLFLRTFRSVFDHVTVWNSEGHDLMIVGTDHPLAPDWPAMKRELERPEAARSLARTGLLDLPTFLSLQVLSEADVDSLAGSEAGPLHTDRRPLLEYRAQSAHFTQETADLLEPVDGRRRPLAWGNLLLHRYLRERGGPTLAELRNLDDFHRGRPGLSQAVLQPGLALELIRRGQARGKEELAEWLFFSKEPRAAAALLGELVKGGSRKFEDWAVYADKTAEQEFKTLSVFHVPDVAPVLDAYRRLATLDPPRADSYEYRRGKTLLAWGRPEEAARALNAALERRKAGLDNVPEADIRSLLASAEAWAALRRARP